MALSPTRISPATPSQRSRPAFGLGLPRPKARHEITESEVFQTPAPRPVARVSGSTATLIRPVAIQRPQTSAYLRYGRRREGPFGGTDSQP